MFTLKTKSAPNKEPKMPFPNEHAARQTDPAMYDDFRRFTPKGAPEGLSMILGLKDEIGRASCRERV